MLQFYILLKTLILNTNTLILPTIDHEPDVLFLRRYSFPIYVFTMWLYLVFGRKIMVKGVMLILFTKLLCEKLATCWRRYDERLGNHNTFILSVVRLHFAWNITYVVLRTRLRTSVRITQYGCTVESSQSLPALKADVVPQKQCGRSLL